MAGGLLNVCRPPPLALLHQVYECALPVSAVQEIYSVSSQAALVLQTAVKSIKWGLQRNVFS